MFAHRAAYAGRVDGGEGGGHDARGKDRLLLRERDTVENQHLSGDVNRSIAGETLKSNLADRGFSCFKFYAIYTFTLIRK